VLGVDADRLAAAEPETGSPIGNGGGGGDDSAHPGEIPMFASLHRAVRIAYRDALADRRSETEAFDRAVALLMEHDALVGRLEARRRVARMLAQEPITTAADGGRR
jgi:hypothetical protein